MLAVLQPPQRDEQVRPRRQLRVAERLGVWQDALEGLKRVLRRSEAVASLGTPKLDLDSTPPAPIQLFRGQAWVRNLLFDQCPRVIEGAVRLLDGVLLQGVLRTLGVIANRLFCSAGLFEVHPEDRGELAAAVRIELFEGLADTSVEVTPLLLEQ